ncbi:hypothetical protein C0J52_19508 [Blattella germanica]|nr:hypothetical protein C0J52_19508 [Blattella germanica]
MVTTSRVRFVQRLVCLQMGAFCLIATIRTLFLGSSKGSTNYIIALITLRTQLGIIFHL